MDRRYGRSIACAGVIFMISVVPGGSVPDVPIWNIDKFVHSLVYFWMTVFLYFDLCRAENHGLTRTLYTAVLLSLTYGGVLELLQQSAIINRTGSWSDFGANGLGALLAAGFILLLNSNRHLQYFRK